MFGLWTEGSSGTVNATRTIYLTFPSEITCTGKHALARLPNRGVGSHQISFEIWTEGDIYLALILIHSDQNQSRLGDLNPGPTHYECVEKFTGLCKTL